VTSAVASTLHQTAGQEAPQQAQRQAWATLRAGRKRRVSGWMRDHRRLAELLDTGQGAGETGEVKAQRHEHQVGGHVQPQLDGQDVVEEHAHGADGAHRRPGHGVAGDTTDVVGQMQRPLTP
jgi:hypothetical protein